MKSITNLCLTIFENSIKEILPDKCVQKAFSVEGNILKSNGRSYSVDKNVYIIGFGKAAAKMVEGAEKVFESNVIGGIASVPLGSRVPSNSAVKFLFGAENNLPDECSIENTNRIIEYLEKIRNPRHIVLFLISGGGSALLCRPISGISLGDKLHTIKLLSTNGADIKQLNSVRTALSEVKGGKLARIAHPSQMISLIISDVIGDPINYIASGPTFIASTTEMRCLKQEDTPINIVRTLGLTEHLNATIIQALAVQYGSSLNCPSNIDVNNVIVGSNQQFLALLARCFEEREINSFVLTRELEGDASTVGKHFANFILQCLRQQNMDTNLLKMVSSSIELNDDLLIKLKSVRRFVLLFGGETTVSFDRKNVLPGGKGGRNQELVLSTFKHLIEELSAAGDCLKFVRFALFSLGTDGQDGPTDAAGAYISSDDINFSTLKNDHSKKHLEESLFGKDSYGFWTSYNNGSNLIKIGKTGTNIMDVQILYLDFENAI